MDGSIEPLERLKAGNARFAAGESTASMPSAERRAALIAGQSPFAIVLSCADSRVVPEFVFDTGAGELFVVRVAGNVANTSTIATIEYAVAHLGMALIVVMGHERCGAVMAALEHGGSGDNGYNLNHLLGHITPARAMASDSSVEAVVKKNAALTALELTTRSKILSDASADGRLTVVSAYYELGSGEASFTC